MTTELTFLTIVNCFAAGALCAEAEKGQLKEFLSPQEAAGVGFKAIVSSTLYYLDEGDPVVVVCLFNSSQQRRHVLKPVPGANFSILVKNNDGTQIALTALGKQLMDHNQSRVKAVYYKLDPGESVRFAFGLSKAFDLTLPARYQISLEYVAGDKDNKPTTLTIKDIPFDIRLKSYDFFNPQGVSIDKGGREIERR